MGCSNMTYSRMDGKIIKQEKIQLDIPNIKKNKELSQAQNLIHLITFLRNKIIFEYDNLIYNTGACIFKSPNIMHCVQCLFYKISADCGGNLNSAQFSFKEDPPFFSINENKISEETKNILHELLEFITKLRDYRILIRQLDKETPKLMYIVFENSNDVSKDNLDKINKAISLFQDLAKLRNIILVEYKNEIYDLIISNNNYCFPINKIANLAIEKNIKDKYEIAFLFNQFKNDEKFVNHFKNDDMSMYKNINEAKEIMEKKLNQERIQEEDIYKENNIISEYQINKSSISTTHNLSNSYKIYLQNT